MSRLLQMNSGSLLRRKFFPLPARCLLIVSTALCLACAGRVPAVEGPHGAANGEYMLFFSTVQGNPLCLFASVQRRQVSSLLSSRNRWEAHVWMILPGASKYLFAADGKNKEDPAASLRYADDTLLFTTDKDRFVFYQPFEADKLLFLSESIFPERAREAREEEIHYGLIPSLLYWNNRKLEGRLFYERRSLKEADGRESLPPVAGLPAGGRAYALWASEGLFVYLERTGSEDSQSAASVALMQNRRGRWEETLDAEAEEPLCAFSSPSCTPGPGSLKIDIPQWGLEGSLEVLQEVKSGFEAHAREDVAAEPTPSQDLLWTSMKEVTEEGGESPVSFCLLKGSLVQGGETRAVYGVGLLSKP